ncbi:CAP domain-containing protein [Serinibacter arcticus]|uniref:CAP domain-containing protein n=1 Tax=Serinibacter arcticus TaxID=1655435 RepID=A0A2U1ZV21_9MICO|nr:CAP domain-containing protein [Serinibacter arcticus]PWD50819.1 CAP domain-containing protein [Serinibacter arcticus]
MGLAVAPLPDGRPMVVVVLGYRADDGAIPAASQGAEEALVLTNAERAAFGLPPLTVSADLNTAAQVQADHQASIGEMTHDGNGGFGERLGAVGYRTGAENVAVGQRSVAEVVQGWISSPGHHANIVNEDMTEMGFAVAFGSDGRAYYAQTFGTR